jgi:hypothetical protein
MSNVLADRHHSGLYHSLQLMAARFGWTLYTPTGRGWWEEGYWAFGRSTYGDDRLAAQFLDQPVSPDNEFPDAPVNFVTLEEAREMRFDFVIASLPDNEEGFARFAGEQGARYVVQVGNTGQWVDWALKPLVLSSSEMPLYGEQGVVYHQEMDPVPFCDPDQLQDLMPSNFSWRRWAGSFVNCMTSMGACWDLLISADMVVDVYGIDGPRGVIKPYDYMIDLMGSYGWGWHDKAQGDGFGHVIHSWAAVGRPLIGHASHYRGKMAERFWRDGETCIDLDKHSVEEAVAIVRTISSDDHAAMCRAIRAEFDQIDYEAEARAIADLLGIGVPA